MCYNYIEYGGRMKKNIVLLILFVIIFVISTIINRYSFSSVKKDYSIEKIGTAISNNEYNFEEYGVQENIAGQKHIDFLSKGLPIFEINLKGVTLQEIHNNSKEIKYDNNKLVIKSGDEVLYNETITLKGRGNSTWRLPKRSYQIKFNQKVDLFELGEAKKWILLANFNDASLIKTYLSHKIGDLVGATNYLDGMFIDLYISGKYLGVYYLTHKVELGKSTLDLNDPAGVLMELDNSHYEHEDAGDVYTSEFGDHFVFKDIKDEQYRSEATTNFINKVNEIDKAIDTGKWNKVVELLDVESVAKYYTVWNFVGGGDAFYTSFYLYMDGANDKIHVGPLWDFDTSFFNKQFVNDKYLDKPTEEEKKAIQEESNPNYEQDEYQKRYMRFLSTRLTKFPEFKIMVKEYQKVIVNNKQFLLDEVDTCSEMIKDSAIRNFKLWEYNDNYEEAIVKIKEYINNKVSALEKEIN